MARKLYRAKINEIGSEMNSTKTNLILFVFVFSTRNTNVVKVFYLTTDVFKLNKPIDTTFSIRRIELKSSDHQRNWSWIIQ